MCFKYSRKLNTSIVVVLKLYIIVHESGRLYRMPILIQSNVVFIYLRPNLLITSFKQHRNTIARGIVATERNPFPSPHTRLAEILISRVLAGQVLPSEYKFQSNDLN